MADTETQNTSIALYRYLCQNIVGTEDIVKTIRQMIAVNDIMSNNKHLTVITSGSFGEGLEMRGSDLDMMYVEKDVEVYENVKPNFNQTITYLSMKMEDVNPGFTQLKLEHIGDKFHFEDFEECNGNQYFSSTLYKQRLSTESVINFSIHGPCLTDENEYMDYASCLHCKTWVSPAVPWISRSSLSWPNNDVKQSIIKHGVLFVPIGVKGSQQEDREWRISFSVAEKLLINTFKHNQLLCYVLLKILLKDVINNNFKFEDLLCSYFMKTIIFWISEELPQSIWKPENLIACFMRCFRRLIYCVEYSVCLHYFIPENNMFENKMEGTNREILLEKLYTLHSFDWRCILFSNQVSNLQVEKWNFPSFYGNDIGKIFNSTLLIATNAEMTRSETKYTNAFRRGIKKIVLCDKSSIKHLYLYHISLYCAVRAQYIQLNRANRHNKYNYQQYKSCLSTLLFSVYHDAVSGWLMLASFFYKTKQYYKALHIIMYSLSKCTFEKLQRFMVMSSIHHRLLKLKILQKKSIFQLSKIIFLDFMTFENNSELIPDELQIEGENINHLIPPIAYAYFLHMLCHYHLKNIRQCKDSVQDLKLVIAENYLLENGPAKSSAINLLGIAFQTLGDIGSAKQAFLHSIELHSSDLCNDSAYRLSLL